MSSEENRAIVRRFYAEVLDGRRPERADQFVAEDYLDHAARPGQAPGLAGAKRKWAMYFAALPDVRTVVEDIVAEGDKVAVRWTGEGTHAGELLGVPPTGKRFRIGGISIYRLAGGKIAEDWEQLDLLGALRQVGALPTPGPGTASARPGLPSGPLVLP